MPPPRDPGRRKREAAQRARDQRVRELLEPALAGWTDDDWEAAIIKDHGKTLATEPEEHTIRRALQ